jgi:hypothetical protein
VPQTSIGMMKETCAENTAEPRPNFFVPEVPLISVRQGLALDCKRAVGRVAVTYLDHTYKPQISLTGTKVQLRTSSGPWTEYQIVLQFSVGSRGKSVAVQLRIPHNQSAKRGKFCRKTERCGKRDVQVAASRTPTWREGGER